MNFERQYDPLSLLSGNDKNHSLTLPAAFIQKLSESQSMKMVLETFSEWVNILFYAERVSLTFINKKNMLELYTISGNQAIPLDFEISIDNTFVGKVYKSRKLMICDDLSKSQDIDCQMLYEKGLQTCMDAPLLVVNNCIGTLNVGHSSKYFFTENHAIKLQCLANWIALNISLHMKISEMNQLALTDHLTGLANRRAFNDYINNSISEFKFYKTKFFLGIIDIDGFKKLNDSFGHDAGDVVLKKLSSKMMESLPENYFLSRIGGEEFAIISPSGCTFPEVYDFLERLRNSVSNITVTYEKKIIKSTISIGFACVNENDSILEGIYKRADMALYYAKKSGRNQIKFMACDNTYR